MIIQACCFFGSAGKIIVGFFIWIDRTACYEMNLFTEYPCIAGTLNITAYCQGEPEEIIGTQGTNAPACWRMPPVLDITLGKLAAGTQEQMFAHETRFSM